MFYKSATHVYRDTPLYMWSKVIRYRPSAVFIPQMEGRSYMGWYTAFLSRLTFAMHCTPPTKLLRPPPVPRPECVVIGGPRRVTSGEVVFIINHRPIPTISTMSCLTRDDDDDKWQVCITPEWKPLVLSNVVSYFRQSLIISRHPEAQQQQSPQRTSAAHSLLL